MTLILAIMVGIVFVIMASMEMPISVINVILVVENVGVQVNMIVKLVLMSAMTLKKDNVSEICHAQPVCFWTKILVNHAPLIAIAANHKMYARSALKAFSFSNYLSLVQKPAIAQKSVVMGIDLKLIVMMEIERIRTDVIKIVKSRKIGIVKGAHQ